MRKISILFTTLALGYMLGALQGGRWYDRLSGHTVLAGGILVMMLAMALMPVMPSLWLLAAVMLVLGVGQGLVDGGSNTLLLWIYRDQAGPWMNGLHFCFGLGTLLAPVVTAQVIARLGDITWAYWALAALMLPGALWLLRLPSPAIPQSALASSARTRKAAADYPACPICRSLRRGRNGVWWLDIQLRYGAASQRCIGRGVPDRSVLGVADGRTPSSRCVRDAPAPEHPDAGQSGGLCGECWTPHTGHLFRRADVDGNLQSGIFNGISFSHYSGLRRAPYTHYRSGYGRVTHRR
jgi:hypothetical protein